MASRSVPEVPKRPAPRPTSTTSNGSDLPETSANKLGSAFMDLDLLGDDDDEYEEPPTRPRAKPQDAPRPRTSTDSRDGSHKLVIAIDYGTTFTGVAFATPKSADANLSEIRVIDNWGKQMNSDLKIPSVISYSPNSNDEQQWGKSLSPESVAMINTKLELDAQDNKTDELELILAVLEGMSNLNFQHVRASKGYPEYTWKSPEEIVTDFLSKIYQVVDREVNQFSTELRAQLPVDIVITVPVGWSYQAKNSTLRAVRTAGFNEKNFPNLQDTIMVTEPEAAAIYTARYLKSLKGEDVLKKDECFVLCDAGGGTVDVVSYQVAGLEPTLELEQIGSPYSSKCGSAYIDTNFKQWLCDILGEKYFRALDPKSNGKKISRTSESSRMRLVIKQFDGFKKNFKGDSATMRIDLPAPIDKINVSGRVKEGELTITNAEMRRFFDPCVDGVVELIQGQLQQIERRGRRLKNIFLIGGFGESEFLQEELKSSLKRRKVEMRRPDTSWTAVVRGAAIYGIEKATNSSIVFMKTSPRSLGIVLNEAYTPTKYNQKDKNTDAVTNNAIAPKQLTWLVKKGDLILSDEGRTTEKFFTFPFQEMGPRKFELPIYEYEDDDLPERYESAREELKTACVLKCDLSGIGLHEFERARNPKTGLPYYIADLVCRMEMSGAEVVIKILSQDTVLSKATLKDIERSSSTSSWQTDRPRESSLGSFSMISPKASHESGLSELPASLRSGRTPPYPM